jgi:hypothetical protein
VMQRPECQVEKITCISCQHCVVIYHHAPEQAPYRTTSLLAVTDIMKVLCSVLALTSDDRLGSWSTCEFEGVSRFSNYVTDTDE